MKIENNKVVELVYELTVDGAVVDKVTEDRPLDFIQGMGMLIPKFETEIEGKEPGDSFEFTIDPLDGYGDYNEDYKFDVPMSSFEVDGKVNHDMLQVGRIIPMLNSSGQACNGIVTEVKENAVTMDFNHPMAGKTLNFKGKILSVRQATDKELTEGLHGEFLPHDCGCGAHGCGCGSQGHGCGTEDSCCDTNSHCCCEKEEHNCCSTSHTCDCK